MTMKHNLNLGVDKNTSIPVTFRPYAKDPDNSSLVLVAARSGNGKSSYKKRQIMEQALIQHIVNNHLNLNNWLRRHGKPMVRKGHPLYNQCKKYKNIKSFEIFTINDGQEYRRLSIN